MLQFWPLAPASNIITLCVFLKKETRPISFLILYIRSKEVLQLISMK